MSKFKKILSMVGLGSPKIPALPVPEIPAPPAPGAVSSSGADVSVGTSADIKNQRVSGRTSSGSGGSKKSNPLGGLGLGGIKI